MPDPLAEIIHFRSKEFIYKNWHYPMGWYFYDDEEDLYGPFRTKEHTERAFRLYLDQLNRGVAPTQHKPDCMALATEGDDAMLCTCNLHQLTRG